MESVHRAPATQTRADVVLPTGWLGRRIAFSNTRQPSAQRTTEEPQLPWPQFPGAVTARTSVKFAMN